MANAPLMRAVGHWTFSVRADTFRADECLKFQLNCRGVAQLAEHWFPKPAVAGSSPSTPAFVPPDSPSSTRGRWGPGKRGNPVHVEPIASNH